MTEGYRQEVLNVVLAQLLHERGIVAAPENIIKKIGKTRKLPDVIVDYLGLRTMIEGEVADQPKAKEKALNAALKRVKDGIAHIGVAVVYPATLRHTEFDNLSRAMANSELQIAISSEANEPIYASYKVADIEGILRHTLNQLIQEDIVADAVTKIDAAIERFAMDMMIQKSYAYQMIEAMDIHEISEERAPSLCRIAGLILTNAMIFQEVLSTQEGKVRSTQKIEDPIKNLASHWKFIIEKINYYPIFHIAAEIMDNVPKNFFLDKAIHVLRDTAVELVQNRAALHRDLMGRIYHRLLADAKYLGTYYTTIPAAALLLKLAIQPNGIAWHDLKQIQDFKVADLSCGTGTLLMASADAIVDNYVSSSVNHGRKINFTKLHKVLYENMLYGYDVLPSAIHLTASTLALRAPEIAFKKMNLYSLPLGGEFLRLGSIEFISGNTLQAKDLFGAAPTTQQMTGTGVEEVNVAEMPSLDLCVMNPPFTRSVGGNLLFGSSPEKERAQMQKRLQQIVKQQQVKANSTAGLGAIFVATGDRYIKEDGRIALILPKALLSGVAWGKTRELINEKYQLEYIIASHDAERWNFSESTDLSEVLLIARKNNGDKTKNHKNKVTAVNLWRNPTTAFDALAIVHVLLRDTPPDLLADPGALDMMMDKRKMGEAVVLDQETVKQNWLFPCAFAQSYLTRVAYHLQNGDVWLPGHAKVGSLPLIALDKLGSLGPDVRDIHDAFTFSEHLTPFLAFWGHSSQSVTSIEQMPNGYLAPLPAPKANRPLRKIESLWPLSGRILLAERLRLNTQRLFAIKLPYIVLSNSWWEVSMQDDITDDMEKALVIWLNSTLHLILLLIHREETEGAWVKFKKPTLKALPVMNPREMTEQQIQILVKTYERIANKALLPFPKMDTDDVRAEIDKAIQDAFGLPDISILRTLLAREPVVCMKRL